MGKLILSSGERTSRPYVFQTVGVRIYSMEELCYFLYHHVYLIDENMLCEDLFQWIASELKLKERAAKLKQLKRQNADLKTLVTVILCSADYYTEAEIKGVLKMMDQIIGMPLVKRYTLKADMYLQKGNYAEAAAEYERIIYSKEASEMTPEEYGDIYHNLAVAKLHITGFREATKLFEQAYLRNHREESLRQFLYSLKLCDKSDEYTQKVEEYQVSEVLQKSIEEVLSNKEEEAKTSAEKHYIDDLNNKKTLGKMREYYQGADELINTWKAMVRQSYNQVSI